MPKFSLLFISCFALALSGCMATDESLSPFVKPGNGSNGSTDGSGSNNGGTGGNSSNNGSTDGTGGNSSNNGGSGGNNSGGSTPPAANCEIPDNSYSLATLGNTGDNSTYDLSMFSKVSAASSLAGTWVLMAHPSVATPAQSSSSAQKYLFVIQDSGSDYKVANCAGIGLISKTYTCVNAAGAVVPCDGSQHNTLPPVIELKPWQPLLEAKIETKEAKQVIRLPLFDGEILGSEKGIELALVGTEFNELKSADGLYQALKISANTNALGSSQAPTNNAGIPVWCSVQVKAVSHSCTNNSDIRLLSVFATTNIEQHRLLTGDGMNGLQITRIYADSDSEDGRNSADYAGSISTQSITTDAKRVQINLGIDQNGTAQSINLNVDAN